MKEGFYAVELLNELAILEVDKSDAITSFQIEFEKEESKMVEFFNLYAVEFNFWEELIKTKNVSYLGKA
jgi:hypothetical protein